MIKPQWSWDNYNGNLKWLPDNTVFMARAGSWAYGTNTASSDVDWRGVAVPPKEYIFGTLHRFEQAEIREPVDCVIFDIRKYVHLASQANPNAIELVFTDPSDVCLQHHYFDWHNIRDKFLTKRVKHTYSGYAISQLKRIQLHRKYLLNPPKKKPERSDFGLPDNTLVPGDQLKAIDAEIRKQIDTWTLDLADLEPAFKTSLMNQVADMLADIKIASQADLWLPAARKLGASDNLIEAMKRERGYASAKREFDNYNEWKTKRNPERAKLEEKYGFDCKHAMHLCRLLRMCREILNGQGVIVKRHDAEELLAIRNGAWTYDQLMEYATVQDTELQEVAVKSTLPNSPDINAIDEWLVKRLEGWYY